jgi:hypothetical protein
VVDLDTARVQHSGTAFAHGKSVGARDVARRIGGHGELAGAVFGIGREVVQALDAVERHADDSGARGVELLHILGERVRLNVATRRVGRRIEVHDYRSLLELVGERVVEGFAVERGLGLERRRHLADFERGERRQCDDG